MCDEAHSVEPVMFDDREDITDIIAQTNTYTTENGYQFDLLGWTHIRDYHKGYLRNVDGDATATVSGLTPNSDYNYAVFQYASGTNAGSYFKVIREKVLTKSF